VVDLGGLAGLNAFDILVGPNGGAVLGTTMLLGFIGNLYRKLQRFKRRWRDDDFDLTFWLQDNGLDMLSSFVVVYVASRLINIVAALVLNMDITQTLITDPDQLHPSDLLILSGLVLGYISDHFEPKLTFKEFISKFAKK
jgi:hypothetical protein